MAKSARQLGSLYESNRLIFYYPLVIFQGLTWFLFLLALLAWAIALVKLLRSKGTPRLHPLYWLLVLGSGMLCVVSYIHGNVSFMLFIPAFVMLLLVMSGRHLKHGVVMGATLLAVAGLCFGTLTAIFYRFAHKDEIVLRSQLFRLAMVTSSDMDCTDSYFVLFACDNISLTCRSLWSSQGYGTCWGSYVLQAVPRVTHLTADEASNRLLVQLDDEVIEIPITE
jgi:hypothetical protein